MIKSIALALLASVAAPAAAQAAPSAQAEQSAIDPQRLALARTTVDSVWPLGTYQRMMDGMMDQMMGGVMDGIFDMKVSEVVPEGKMSEEDKAKAEMTLRDAIAAKDPHFEERMRITNEVMMSEMGAIFSKVEPAVREGLTNAFAKRFDTAQLTDLNRFFATPTGKYYAQQSMLLFMDPELMKAMMGSMPELMQAMPAIMEKVKAATAHLPEPPKDEDEQEQSETAEPTA